MSKGFDDLLKKVSACDKKKVAVAVAEDAPRSGSRTCC